MYMSRSLDSFDKNWVIEPKGYKEKSSFMKFDLSKEYKLLNCFQNIIDGWITLRTNPQADVATLMNEIDQHVNAGINILNNQEIPNGINEIR